jgi:C4-dicarboxylate transporter DctM subunit
LPASKSRRERNQLTEAIIGLLALLILAFLRIPIAFVMMGVGVAGMAYVSTLSAALYNVGQTAYDAAINYELSVVPLFILMGNFVARSRLAEELYGASYSFFGHRKGGLAMATIVACGGFSAICGSSLATAATMSKVAMPSMRKYGYDDALATGSIAAGGTLGILIPPSVILVIYGILTQSSIGKLFAAGVIPGIIGVLFYLGAVRYTIWIKPETGPAGERQTWSQRIRAMSSVWGVVVLFAVVMGGIYGGVFSPTEAAGIGAVGAFMFALLRKTLTIKVLFQILEESALTTAMLFTILIGALLFANFINLTDFPQALLAIASQFSDTPWLVILAILVIYLILGCLFESLSMILLTVPILFPLVVELGYDPIWFGIVVVVVTEISLITPPVGLNVFVLKGVLPDVKTSTIFKGVTPFWVADIFRLALIVLVPWASLWLPSMVR